MHQLEDLAFGDHVGRVGKDCQHPHPIDADHQLERARIEKIADQHRGGVAELGIGGGVPPPQLRFVDDVVVQQRGRVDHLDHGRQRVMIAAAIAAGAGREQQQARAKPLAAAADDVFGNLADQHDVGREARAQHGVHFGHIGPDNGL